MAVYESAMTAKDVQAASEAAKQLAVTFGNSSIVAAIDSFIQDGENAGLELNDLAEIVDRLHMTHADAISRLQDVNNRQKLASEAFERTQEALETLSDSVEDNAIASNRFATQMKTVADKLKDFRNFLS